MNFFYNIVSLLKPKRYAFMVKVPGTDLDILAITDNNEIVVVEVKAKLHHQNLYRVLLQLEFRKWLANRVYLATTYDNLIFINKVPREYGIIVTNKKSAWILRKSAYFNYPYTSMTRILLR